jgi:hypothetical protein
LTGWVCLGFLIYKGDPRIASLPAALVFTVIAATEIATVAAWRSDQKKLRLAEVGGTGPA